MENKQEQELLLLIQNTQQFPDSQILKAKGVEDIFVSVMTGLKDAAVDHEPLGHGPWPRSAG